MRDLFLALDPSGLTSSFEPPCAGSHGKTSAGPNLGSGLSNLMHRAAVSKRRSRPRALQSRPAPAGRQDVRGLSPAASTCRAQTCWHPGHMGQGKLIPSPSATRLRSPTSKAVRRGLDAPHEKRLRCLSASRRRRGEHEVRQGPSRVKPLCLLACPSDLRRITVAARCEALARHARGRHGHPLVTGVGSKTARASPPMRHWRRTFGGGLGSSHHTRGAYAAELGFMGTDPSGVY